MKRKHSIAAVSSAALLAVTLAACAGDTGDGGNGGGDVTPIRIGSTLALTGGLAGTGIIHETAGKEFVKWLNENGGLLGRPVEWVLYDDASNPATAADQYRKLITEDNVDLIIGPYATNNVVAAAAVAEEYGKVYVHHTGTLPYALDYEWAFPLWAGGVNASETVSTTIFEAFEDAPDAPQTVAFVLSENAAPQFIARGHAPSGSKGAIDIARDRGLDVVLELDYPATGTPDWAAIAQQIKAADPDLLWVGSLAANSPDLLNALVQADWQPRHQFHLYPAPGPLLGTGDLAENAVTVTYFENNAAFLQNEGARNLVDRFGPAATAAGISYTEPEAQAGTSWSTWQTLVAGVEGAGSLNDADIARYLLNNTIKTAIGDIRFDPAQANYYGDFTKIKQIQDGKFTIVYPAEFAGGARIR